ncbi:MAG: hypothetical protein ACJ8EW_11220 [Rhizobium sp.]
MTLVVCDKPGTMTEQPFNPQPKAFSFLNAWDHPRNLTLEKTP